MTQTEHEPHQQLPSFSGGSGTATRHDGWTGERMATFCEVLAETGLVADACHAAGKSTVGAYALRRRNPMFAAAWETALTMARERLADTLLARSIEGSVEQYYKDGELVGEKRVTDNRLGLAILRRLDRMAETGSPVGKRGERAAVRPVPRSRVDWDLALDALRTGDPDSIAEALATIKADELNELNDPPNSLVQGDGDEQQIGEIDVSHRCWQEEDGEWWTDFPPPEGFDGWRQGEWGDSDYKRICTPEETRLLNACKDADAREERAEDESLRDAYFAALERELELEDGADHPGHPRLEPGSAFTSDNSDS